MAKGRLATVKLELIRVNPVALREVNRQSQQFVEIRDSIKARGVLEPIQLREKKGEDGKQYELINGLQRFTASQIAEFPDIPAQILEASDADVLEQQIITNATRVETRPAEFAKGLQRILAMNMTMTETELAAKLNKSPAWIGKMLSLNKLDDPIKALVDEGKIPLASAYAMTRLPVEEQAAWAARAQTEDSATFSQKVIERSKQIRAAHRAGQEAGADVFTPVPRFRKRTEVLSEMENANNGLALAKQLEIAKKFKGDDLVREAFRLGVQWVVQMDPISVSDAKAKDDERKKKETQDKARRAKERADAKAKEANENLAGVGT